MLGNLKQMKSLSPKRTHTILWVMISMALLSNIVSARANNSNLLSSDVNDDGIVDIVDFAALALAYGSHPGHPNWNPGSDLNDDDAVDIYDLVLLQIDFGKSSRFYDFDEPLDWNVASGTWSILNGLLDGFGNAEILIYTEDIIWRDCTLTARVKIAADSPSAEAGLCVGFRDSGNFYWAGLGCWGHRVSISRMVDYVPEELVFSGDEADVVEDVWYIVSVKISGGTIMLYVNGVLELSINDSTFAGGVIGIRSWNSHILVDYATVEGSEFTWLPPLNTQLEAREGTQLYYGFAWSGGDFTYKRATREHFRTVKDWGFDTIIARFHWADVFEPDPYKPYVYDQENLQAWRTVVDRAKSEGLEVILAGWLCYDDNSVLQPGVREWEGWSDHDYVNLNRDYVVKYDGSRLSGLVPGLERYARFWEMIVQRFPDCMYCFEYYPYHRDSAGWGSTRETMYYETVFPTLLNAVRKYSNNYVVFVPIHQSGGRHNTESASNYYYRFDRYEDEHIIYGLGHMLPWDADGGGGSWDYDYDKLELDFEGIKVWRQRYPDLPMLAIEYAGLSGTEPFDQEKLDCLEEYTKRMSQYDVGYLYHWLSLGHGTRGDNVLKNTATFEPKWEIVRILQAYIKS